MLKLYFFIQFIYFLDRKDKFISGVQSCINKYITFLKHLGKTFSIFKKYLLYYLRNWSFIKQKSLFFLIQELSFFSVFFFYWKQFATDTPTKECTHTHKRKKNSTNLCYFCYLSFLNYKMCEQKKYFYLQEQFNKDIWHNTTTS